MILEDAQPLEFVRHVRVVQAAAVRYIQRPHTHSAAGRSHGAGFLDRLLFALAEHGLVGEGAFHVLETHA